MNPAGAILLFLLVAGRREGMPTQQFDPPDLVAEKFLAFAKAGAPAAIELLEDKRPQARSQFEAAWKEEWGVPSGYKSSEIGKLEGEFVRGDWGLFLYRRIMTAEKETAEREKNLYAKKIQDYFPENQHVFAKKLIYWKGNEFHTLRPIYVHRREDTYPFLVAIGERGQPLPAIRAAMMRKWHCNILRWFSGEAGEPLGDFVFGERPEMGPKARSQEIRCLLPETGAPCVEGDKGCLDLKGKSCKPDERDQSIGQPLPQPKSGSKPRRQR